MIDISLYTIGDLHLSFSNPKPMDVFVGWEDYTRRIEENWNAVVSPDDTVVVCGDISWAMSLDEAVEDFAYIERLNGKKLIMKGNHDFWWATKKKLDAWTNQNGFSSIGFLYNNAYSVDGVGIVGTRGWLDEQDEHDEKVLAREVGRLRLSIDGLPEDAKEPIAFLHYPPIYRTSRTQPIIDVLNEFGIKKCFYGHIHGEGIPFAVNGDVGGIFYRLVSADALKYMPYKIF